MVANKSPAVSSLSGFFKKAVAISEDAEEVKKGYRANIKTLVDKYFQDVGQGKADGIRTAKEFAEIVKLELLLIGEATERKDDVNSLDEAKVAKLTQIMDISNPDVAAVMQNIFEVLNKSNDDADDYVPHDVNSPISSDDVPESDIDINTPEGGDNDVSQ